MVIGVTAAIGLSFAFALNGGSSGAAGGGNWASVPLLTRIVVIFGTIFAFIQAYVLHAIKQLSSQMAQMDTRLTNQIGAMDKRMNERFTLMENRFSLIEERFTQLDNRIDGRFAQIEGRFTQLGNRIDGRFAHVDQRFTQVDKRLDSLNQNYVDDMKYHLREE